MARNNEIECLESLKCIFQSRFENVYSNCYLDDITKYLFYAKSNDEGSKFPDFIFEGGCIEHFQVTSSKETKKGSDFKIKEFENKPDKLKFIKEFKEYYESTPFNKRTICSDSYKQCYTDFAYEYFLKSLYNNINHHVNSLSKSKFKDQIVVFLIEQQTARLFIEKDSNTVEFYQLHKDKNALLKIKEICTYVNYLVYFVCDAIEIIDLSTIDNLIEKAMIYENVKGGRLIDATLLLGFDI